MTQMMETLESRQMFSVTLAEPTALPVDTSVPAEVAGKKVNATSPKLSAACCTGAHYKDVTISM